MGVITAVVLFIGALLSDGTRYEEAITAYESHKFGDAEIVFRELALKGHAGAEAMLGVMYYNGQGVPKNEALAAIWLFKAANKGVPSAQLALGSLHIKGLGVRANVFEAYKWLKLAEKSDVEKVKIEAARIIVLIKPLLSEDELLRVEDALANWRPITN